MIPILYDKTETAFVSNGLARLRDCVSCVVSETRNGAYECDFEYPVSGAHFDLIQIGRIIGVTHDETDDIQPFDIISYTKPIEGVVTFHAVHISYRQSYLTVTGSNINSLEDAFTLFASATPTNPFIYSTDKNSTGYLSIADGVPKTVRQMLGGTEGSVLDTYGGEYVWDKWNVKLLSARGRKRDVSIYYGVNMMSYNEECDSSSCYSSCIPYWTDGSSTVIGDKQTAPGITASGRDQCIPLDVSDKFEGQPTKAQVETMGLSLITSQNTTAPTQNITVSFIRLQDMAEYESYQQLMMCELCDTINVVFPESNSSGNFKIVKTVWNVLTSRYEEMELGTLSTTLSEALGIGVESRTSYSGGGGTTDYTDLDNKPQINNVTLVGNMSLSDLGINIPTVNNATLTIQKNGTTVKTFTANASTNVTANITVPTKVSDLANDSGYITDAGVTSFNGNTGAVTYTAPVTSVNGNTGAVTINVPTITDTYSGTSSDGMSGKAVKSAIDALDGTITGRAGSDKTLTAFSQTDGKVSATFGNISITKSQVSDFPTLSAVATSGDYDDLIDKPSLSTVATSGDYDDLINKPTIPTVNDATLTIQKNGATIAQFTANDPNDVVANIQIPTNVSAFTNDAGYLNDATVGDLAYQDSATGSYTPAGSVTINSYTPEGTISTGTGTANYTPAGSVSAPTITVTPSTTTVNSITAVGTLPAWSASVINEVLSFSFDTGTLPTKGSNTTVMTGASASSSQPSFTGTGANLKFTGTAKAPTGSFTGTAATITVE